MFAHKKTHLDGLAAWALIGIIYTTNAAFAEEASSKYGSPPITKTEADSIQAIPALEAAQVLANVQALNADPTSTAGLDSNTVGLNSSLAGVNSNAASVMQALSANPNFSPAASLPSSLVNAISADLSPAGIAKNEQSLQDAENLSDYSNVQTQNAQQTGVAAVSFHDMDQVDANNQAVVASDHLAAIGTKIANDAALPDSTQKINNLTQDAIDQEKWSSINPDDVMGSPTPVDVTRDSALDAIYGPLTNTFTALGPVQTPGVINAADQVKSLLSSIPGMTQDQLSASLAAANTQPNPEGPLQAGAYTQSIAAINNPDPASGVTNAIAGPNIAAETQAQGAAPAQTPDVAVNNAINSPFGATSITAAEQPAPTDNPAPAAAAAPATPGNPTAAFGVSSLTTGAPISGTDPTAPSLGVAVTGGLITGAGLVTGDQPAAAPADPAPSPPGATISGDIAGGMITGAQDPGGAVPGGAPTSDAPAAPAGATPAGDPGSSQDGREGLGLGNGNANGGPDPTDPGDPGGDSPGGDGPGGDGPGQ